MQTLEEFIQRLQDDAAFEQQAQAFVTGEELMAFVQREGYDFTLEQLMEKFQPEAKSPAVAGATAPAPLGAGTSTPEKPEGFSPGAIVIAGPESDRRDFTRQQSGEEVQNPAGAMLPPGPEEKTPVEWSRGGGGRHRGFPLQRLKSIVDEES
jgi:predicted ribosomally synthesized peptide with nif11-like leader